MSSTKLADAKIVIETGSIKTELGGPVWAHVKKLHRWMYAVAHYARHPIKPAFLRMLLEEWGVFFHNRKFYEEFTTTDGTVWIAIRFEVHDVRYYLLFPKELDETHQDGTVSSHHIALYYEADIPPKSADVEHVMEMVYHLAKIDLRTFEQRQ